MASSVSCIGDLTTNSGYPQCSGHWEIIHQEPPFDPSQLDPASLSMAWGAGFTMVAFCLILSMGIRTVISYIKSLE